MQHLYLNEKDPWNKVFDLESPIRGLASIMKNTAVISYYDCCRETIGPDLDVKPPASSKKGRQLYKECKVAMQQFCHTQPSWNNYYSGGLHLRRFTRTTQAGHQSRGSKHETGTFMSPLAFMMTCINSGGHLSNMKGA